MSILGYEKKVKVVPKKRKKLSHDDKMKGVAATALSEIADKDSSVKAALIKKYHGIEIAPEDESRESEKKLRGQFYNKLLKKYEEADEETVFSEREEEILDKILGVKRSPGGARYNEYFAGGEGEGSPLDAIKTYRELEREFGSSTGALGFLKDPDVITSVLGFITNMMGKGPLPGGNGPTGGHVYVVEIDGEAVEMPEAAYRAYLSQRKRLRNAEATALTEGAKEKPAPKKPAGKEAYKAPGIIMQPADDGSEVMITPIYANKPASGKGESEPAAPPPAEADITQFLPYAPEILEAMGGDPEQFALELINAANEGNGDAYSLATFLKSVTYDTIMEMLEPYKAVDAMVEHIAKFDQNREWGEKALSKIQSLPLAEQSIA